MGDFAEDAVSSNYYRGAEDDNDGQQQERDEQQQLTKGKTIMDKQEKPQKQLTPVGEAKWAHVHTPKAAFTDKIGHTKGEPKYAIEVYFGADDPAWKTWAAQVMAKLRELPDHIDKKTGETLKKQTPIKRELDQDDKPTGRFYVTFKTGEKFKPGVFDAFGNPTNSLIGNGSKVRVNYSGNVYDAFGGGINFYLNAVQVVELVEYQSQTAAGYGFDVAEAPAQGGSTFDEEFDSGIPF